MPMSSARWDYVRTARSEFSMIDTVVMITVFIQVVVILCTCFTSVLRGCPDFSISGETLCATILNSRNHLCGFNQKENTG